MRKKTYEEYGCQDRKHYLILLSVKYEVPLDIVEGMAHVLGKEEDFDELVDTLSEYWTA